MTQVFASKEAERAARLRELMEAKWREPQVTNAHRRCKWIMPMELGGSHGYRNNICDDNVKGGNGS